MPAAEGTITLTLWAEKVDILMNSRTSAMHLVCFVFAFISSPVLVCQNTAAIAPILQPFPVVTSAVGPNHVPSPGHLVVRPLTLIPECGRAMRNGSESQMASASWNLLASVSPCLEVETILGSIHRRSRNQGSCLLRRLRHFSRTIQLNNMTYCSTSLLVAQEPALSFGTKAGRLSEARQHVEKPLHEARAILHSQGSRLITLCSLPRPHESSSWRAAALRKRGAAFSHFISCHPSLPGPPEAGQRAFTAHLNIWMVLV